MLEASVLAGLLAMGLSSGVHCIGMCGGVAAALGFAVDPQRTSLAQRLPVLLGYNLGRVVSYSIAGALVGLLGMLSRQLHSDMMVVLRTFAALLLVMMAFYLADWWRGLVRLEKMGSGFWRLLQPLGRRLMPVRTPGRALFLGMLWGWLPCGLVYSALALAATVGNPAGAALGMAIFGLCTMPAMLAGGIFSNQIRSWLQNRTLRTVMALLLLGFAVWVFWTGAGHVLTGYHSEGALHCEPWH